MSAALDRDADPIGAAEHQYDADRPCEKCGGDGYTESWNADQTDVVITLCTDCGPAPGEVDG